MDTIDAMLALLALAFIVLPIVEIYVILQVGHAIGALNTVAVLLLVAIAGAWLAKHEGFYVLARLRAQLDAGRLPTNELIDGTLILIGAILLITPGFVTDVMGIFLLFPPTRALLRGLVKRRFHLQLLGPGPGWPGAPGRTSGPTDRRDPPDDIIDV